MNTGNHEPGDRVVVTGFGAACAIGCNPTEIARNLRARQSGVERVRISDDLTCWFGKTQTADSLFPCPQGDRSVDFAMDCAAQALAHSQPEVAPHRAATIISSSKGLLNELLSGLDSHRKARTDWSGDNAGLRIARKHGFTGPVLNYPAACATGLVSLISAANLLQDGLADFVIAGSCEASGIELTLAAFQNMGALSNELSSPFSTNRQGFNPGEGAAVFALELESRARQRGAKILAAITGWDFRSDACDMTGIESGGDTIAYSIQRTLAAARWKSSQVEYINAHGTGTWLNDKVECDVIARMFPSPDPWVSSLKPYVGHTLGASGAVELAVTLIALRDRFVPPTIRLESPDPAFKLRFVMEPGLNTQVTRFLKLSLGFGGHIAALAVEVV